MPTYVTSSNNAPMTNFDNLKKQAKQYLHWHRDRYYPVAAQIREVLPRFQHLNDPQILASQFKLSDAQELVDGVFWSCGGLRLSRRARRGIQVARPGIRGEGFCSLSHQVLAGIRQAARRPALQGVFEEDEFAGRVSAAIMSGFRFIKGNGDDCTGIC